MSNQSYTPDPAAADALESLHDRSVDVLAGFDTMVGKAEPHFRPLAMRFQDLHRRHSTELAGLLAAAGRTPGNEGTFMSTVNRAVVSLRSIFDDIDEDILAQVESGEQHVLDAFDEALAQPQAPDARARLSDMRQELVRLLDEAKAAQA
ncbi:ferritin-like domain-containing protein [Cereibacter sediminicola]|uniref:ferritin-like domain-containing protein n=1 Tax=Cereibacter sediminicola TaxID=2584941 RepID=UPI0011A4F15D|nr:PA2169 family four-helix-bundle protein [Cereibacter sediminicola]